MILKDTFSKFKYRALDVAWLMRMSKRLSLCSTILDRKPIMLTLRDSAREWSPARASWNSSEVKFPCTLLGRRKVWQFRSQWKWKALSLLNCWARTLRTRIVATWLCSIRFKNLLIKISYSCHRLKQMVLWDDLSRMSSSMRSRKPKVTRSKRRASRPKATRKVIAI